MKEEQKLFSEFVSNQWKTKLCSRLLSMTEGHEKFIEEEWSRQLKTVDKYPPFYQMISMLPIVYLNEENPIEVVEVKRLQNEVGDILTFVLFLSWLILGSEPTF